MEGTTKRRVLIVEDHRVFAEALQVALEVEGGFECVGTAPTVEDALELAGRCPPDVVLMDVSLPGCDGVEGTRLMKRRVPDAQVVVLTGRVDRDLVGRAGEAGASAFLPKQASFAEVVGALRVPRRTPMLVDASVVARLLEDERAEAEATRRAEDLAGVSLTRREREVLALMGDGLDPQRIARELTMSVHTARGHVKEILAKLGVHSQLEAVVTALRKGLLPKAG